MKKRVLAIFCLFVAIFFSIQLYISFTSSTLYYTGEGKEFGIILGAKVKGNTPSDILKDRLDSAFELFEKKKIQKVLITGDNSIKEYDETSVMKAYLLKKGVPEKDIFTDFAGFDTYDSLYRARDIFSVTNAIIFTQNFHLPRSLYIAKRLGLDIVGYSSDKHAYVKIYSFTIREYFANIKAFFDVEILHSTPTFLGEKIR